MSSSESPRIPPPSVQCLLVRETIGEGETLRRLPSASSFKGGSVPEELIAKTKESIEYERYEPLGKGAVEG